MKAGRHLNHLIAFGAPAGRIVNSPYSRVLKASAQVQWERRDAHGFSRFTFQSHAFSRNQIPGLNSLRARKFRQYPDISSH